MVLKKVKVPTSLLIGPVLLLINLKVQPMASALLLSCLKCSLRNQSVPSVFLLPESVSQGHFESYHRKTSAILITYDHRSVLLKSEH